jgi:hypothetical protein
MDQQAWLANVVDFGMPKENQSSRNGQTEGNCD